MTSLISLSAAAERVGVHGATLLRWSAAGRFPKPLKLGDARNASIRFALDEIEAWLEERKAART